MNNPSSRQLPTIAAAIIIQGESFLLVKRQVVEELLSWQFPAGEVERDESVEAAAVRETREEVGLEVSALKVLGERVHPNTGRNMVYIACEVLSGKAYVADNGELTDIAWTTIDECRSYVPHGFAPVVEDYLDVALTQGLGQVRA
jgi:8-oxo-dGTP diphosphatase